MQNLPRPRLLKCEGSTKTKKRKWVIRSWPGYSDAAGQLPATFVLIERGGMDKITAQHISNLICIRHNEDVVVPECKNGPTHGGSHLRLDIWTMARSWSKPMTTGYEIKISRSDFLKDDKWEAYLNYCNKFYFACPYGLIAPEELPQDVGLVWVSKTGAKLYTKRKAVFRDIQIPESIFRYVLMCRTFINEVDISHDSRTRRLQHWEKWLKDREKGGHLGWEISKKIRKIYDETLSENQRLQNLMKSYDQIRQLITELGFDPDAPYGRWQIENKLEELKRGVSQDFKNNITNAIKNLEAIQEKLDG